MKRFLILDDHALFAGGLELLLQEIDEEASICCFSTAPALLEAIGAGQPTPDLIISDYYVPGSEPGETIAAIVAAAPGAPLMVVSGSVSTTDKEAALAAGAHVFVPKHAPPETLLETIRKLLDGGVDVELDEMPPAPALAALEQLRLTQRQLDILTLIAAGDSNKQIARRLDVSPETVKTHLKVIFGKLKVSNRIEAIDFMRRNGVI
ncbi:MAG: response regulator transcription factor [Neomegalonema sp.]|nr:response regulator transcription factor [Neomegalonema sp.]